LTCDISKGLCLPLAAAGLFVLAAVLAFVIRRLSAAVAERDAALDRLREAYRDLEATKPLRELGKSAAFINHEIKNYMMVVSGYAALLLRSKKLDEKDRAMVDNIAVTAAKLHDLNMNVLELSRSMAGSEDTEIELAQRLRACIDIYFAGRASDISVSCDIPQDTLLINGNPEKLDRAFVSAIRNSFEAGARTVSIRLSICNLMALIVIEDDGAGCGAEQFPNLSTTFFTTKRGGCGMGLGLCVIRSIVEAHNGRVSIYAKNILGVGKHGLSMQILIPASKKTPYTATKAEVILVKDRLPGVPEIMKILNSLKIIPRTIGQAKDIGNEKRNSLLNLIIIAGASKAKELRELTGNNGKAKVLPIEEAESGAGLGAGALLVVGDDGNAGSRELFTEEYVAIAISL